MSESIGGVSDTWYNSQLDKICTVKIYQPDTDSSTTYHTWRYTHVKVYFNPRLTTSYLGTKNFEISKSEKSGAPKQNTIAN